MLVYWIISCHECIILLVVNLAHLEICLLRVLMLNYRKYGYHFFWKFLNCIKIAVIQVLHVKNDTERSNWWQVIVSIFLSTWIIFFSLPLKFYYAVFMKDEIQFSSVIYCIIDRNVVFVVLQKHRMCRSWN